jgi:hypothetical protein
MKIFIFFVLSAVLITTLYIGAIFAGFNLPKPSFLEDKGIAGDATLKVTLLMDNNLRNPLSKIEVDVAKEPGPPPKGGIAYTDEQGVATFNIKPGEYYIYFNTLNFPKNLSVPREQAVTVAPNAIAEKTLLITTAKQ